MQSVPLSYRVWGFFPPIFHLLLLYYFTFFLKTLLFLHYLVFLWLSISVFSLKPKNIVKHTATCLESFSHMNLLYCASEIFSVYMSKTLNLPCGLARGILVAQACRQLQGDVSLYHSHMGDMRLGRCVWLCIVCSDPLLEFSWVSWEYMWPDAGPHL